MRRQAGVARATEPPWAVFHQLFSRYQRSDPAQFAGQELVEEYPYLILDTRYEQVREDSVLRTQALMVAQGINWEGRRQVLGAELANRESASSWRKFLPALKQRGLSAVECVVSENQPGLKHAIVMVLPKALWQRYAASCLRLVCALAVEVHEDWMESTRYSDMELRPSIKRRCCTTPPKLRKRLATPITMNPI